MTDYIERDAAISELMDVVEHHRHDKFGGCLIHWTGVKAMLECIPAADVRPVVRGKWVRKHDDVKYWSDCSECGMRACRDNWGLDCESNFCPYCGADMREENE